MLKILVLSHCNTTSFGQPDSRPYFLSVRLRDRDQMTAMVASSSITSTKKQTHTQKTTTTFSIHFSKQNLKYCSLPSKQKTKKQAKQQKQNKQTHINNNKNTTNSAMSELNHIEMSQFWAIAFSLNKVDLCSKFCIMMATALES